MVLSHDEVVTVREMARKLGLKMQEVQKQLTRLGEQPHLAPDTVLELDTAELVALEFGRKVDRIRPEKDPKTLR